MKFLCNRERISQLISLVLALAIGWLISSKVLFTPLTDSDFEYYEQLAQNIYNQGEQGVYELPEKVGLEKTPTSIRIFSERFFTIGEVTAVFKNGNLEFSRRIPQGGPILSALILSMFIALLFLFVLDVSKYFFWIVIISRFESQPKSSGYATLLSLKLILPWGTNSYAISKWIMRNYSKYKAHTAEAFGRRPILAIGYKNPNIPSGDTSIQAATIAKDVVNLFESRIQYKSAPKVRSMKVGVPEGTDFEHICIWINENYPKYEAHPKKPSETPAVVIACR